LERPIECAIPESADEMLKHRIQRRSCTHTYIHIHIYIHNKAGICNLKLSRHFFPPRTVEICIFPAYPPRSRNVRADLASSRSIAAENFHLPSAVIELTNTHHGLPDVPRSLVTFRYVLLRGRENASSYSTGYG